MKTLAALAVGIVVASGCRLAVAQETAPLAVVIERSGAGVEIKPGAGITLEAVARPGAVSLVTGKLPILLQLTCVGTDCTQASITLDGNLLPAVNAQSGGVVALTGIAAASDLIVAFPAATPLRTTLQFAAGGAAPPDGFVNSTDLSKLLQNPCSGATAPMAQVLAGDGANFIFVTPTGKILDRHGNLASNGGAPPPTIAENETLRVVVRVDRQLIKFLDIRRKSAPRNRDAIRILGASQPASSLQVATTAAPPPASLSFARCEYKEFDLQDFAPGDGQVEIVFPVNNQLSTLGTFSFRVNSLYWGALSFGPVYTSVFDKPFSVAPTATQGTGKIVNGEGGDRVLYTIFLTPYLTQRVLATSQPWYAHLNPTLGLALNDVTDHALLGLSWDFGLAVLSGGVHFAKVTEVDPNSGLKLGSTITTGGTMLPSATAIPTEKQWKAGWFVGLGLDMRVAGQLLQAAIGGMGGGAKQSAQPAGGGAQNPGGGGGHP
ncbi:MAG TPA: hypothetical protein VKY89_04430 [Thermoanaerobaculia bacterium]|nr:hypothetical protein [Thermoanaerobaculia bacterium]